ncbi:MAG TPA: TetR/AcrR family transcriptional regulator [Tepidisphaeraceae bacterium]|jgi:AcrR family transcriptional regulator|nr:TetR/AcrR family transcriptional regulator [Tepidisphaeraceae bacterium]
MPRLKAPQRRSQLIETATKLFARSGYASTTTAAIAEAAGVTEPVLYRHFQSKQDLFIAITRKMSDDTLREWQSIIGNIDDPAEQIRTIAVEFPAHIKRMEDAYHVLHGALATSREKKVLTVIKDHYDQFEKFFVGMIKKGQDRGVFRKDVEPIMASWQLINMGLGYALIALNLGRFEHFSVEESIGFIVEGLRPD